MLAAGFGIALHEQVERAGMRKLWRRAEPAVISVEKLHCRFHHAVNDRRGQRSGLPGKALRAADGGHHAVSGLDHVSILLAIRLGQGAEDPAKAGTPVMVLWRKICAREERFTLGR